MWDTAVDVNVCNDVEDEVGGRKREGWSKRKRERGVRGLTHDTVTALQRESSTWPKWPAG